MKKTVLVTALFGMISTPMLADSQNKLDTAAAKLGYTIGVDLGSNFKQQEIDVDVDAVAHGMQDALKGTELKMTEDEMRDTLQDFQKELYAKRAAKFQALADKNKATGDKFLAENKVKKGVVTLESGLQYKIIKAGNGAQPKTEDSVTVEYEGRLINGEVFDSSKEAEAPVTFKLSQVIPGWSEALQLMKEGATWEVFVPAELAYGTNGVGSIGPNETLIFNIHLIKIDKESSASKKE